jgi:hypothetical protein
MCKIYSLRRCIFATCSIMIMIYRTNPKLIFIVFFFNVVEMNEFWYEYLKGLHFFTGYCVGDCILRWGLHILCRCCHQNETSGKQSNVADMNGTQIFQIRRSIRCTGCDAPVLHQIGS